jgi:hypothetical protein
MNDAHGVIHIHSCPVALAPNVEWTISHVLGTTVRLSWTDQSCELGTVRASIEWSGPAGSASRCTSALRGWEQTRFEVWESTGVGRDGVRYAHTPALGVFYTLTDAAGNSMVGEDRVRYAMELAQGDAAELEHELARALGCAWDDELEPYRQTTTKLVTPLRQRTSAN